MSKAQRTRSAREKLEQVRARQRAEARRRMLIVGTVAGVAVGQVIPAAQRPLGGLAVAVVAVVAATLAVTGTSRGSANRGAGGTPELGQGEQQPELRG